MTIQVRLWHPNAAKVQAAAKKNKTSASKEANIALALYFRSLKKR